jgi:hypothetical protein
MPMLGAICDIARNLFYLLTIILIGYLAYSIYRGNFGTPLSIYLAIAWAGCFMVWRITKGRLGP